MMDSRVYQQCVSVSLSLCLSRFVSLCLSLFVSLCLDCLTGCQKQPGGLHTVSHGRLASSQQRLHMTQINSAERNRAAW